MDTLENLHQKIEEVETEYQQRILAYSEAHGQPPDRDLLHLMEAELKQRLIAVSLAK